MNCPFCGNPLKKGTRFCNVCGTQVKESTAFGAPDENVFSDSGEKEVFFCPQCGKELPKNSYFCGYCGVSLVAPQEENEYSDEPYASDDDPAPSARLPESSTTDEGMFKNIGKKIKTYAKLLFTISAILSFFLGMLMLFIIVSISLDLLIWGCLAFILIFVFGMLISYIAVMLMYGFGELVDSSVETARTVRTLLRRLNKIPKIR